MFAFRLDVPNAALNESDPNNNVNIVSPGAARAARSRATGT
jgi:hypothetical protein